MTKIVDLDALAPEPITVKLAGQQYRLPGDIPMPLMLRLEQAAGSEVSGDLLHDLYGDLLGLFQVHQPELTELPIGTTQIIRAIPAIYYGVEPDPPKPAKKPAAKRKSAGTRSTPRRSTTRSR